MHQIRYFLAVSETLNLTKAAERCNVAQPSLTRALKALECELGGELLRRERALSHLTELGHRLLPMLRQCYETALAAKLVADSIKRGEAASLSMGVSETISLRPIMPKLQELWRSFPGLDLDLLRWPSTEVSERLKEGTADMAIAGPLNEAWSRLDAFPLFEERIGLIASRLHNLANRSVVSFDELRSERIIINRACETSEIIKARLREGGVDERSLHQVATYEDLLAFAGANFGIAIVPYRAYEPEDLCRIDLSGFCIARKVSVYTVAGRKRSTIGGTLLNMLRASDWELDMLTDGSVSAH
jgi:DNA-binding transcriptional LysR family regulator